MNKGALAVALAILTVSCTRVPPSPAARSTDRAAPPASAAPVAVAVGAPPAAPSPEREYGAPTVIDRLAIYPITSKLQTDVGPLVLLDDAVVAGEAEVREAAGGPTVNTLALDNKGKVPIFVLAGTIVKGGNQDRQIGQDFIAPPKATTPLDAYCVEHGRWTAQRDGRATGGRFVTTTAVAPAKIRAAGQYKKSQSEVWSKVGEANAANKRDTASGTFLASVDDAKLAAERAKTAAEIEAALGAVAPQEDLVGVAYAIDGEVRGVRWFAHHGVFAMVERKLASGIALEAQTAKAEAAAHGPVGPPRSPPPPSAVEAFVSGTEKEEVKEARETAGSNVNEYKESAEVYSSKTMMKPMGKGGVKKPVSADFTKK